MAEAFAKKHKEKILLFLSRAIRQPMGQPSAVRMKKGIDLSCLTKTKTEKLKVYRGFRFDCGNVIQF
jgi:hypothetical protein